MDGGRGRGINMTLPAWMTNPVRYRSAARELRTIDVSL